MNKMQIIYIFNSMYRILISKIKNKGSIPLKCVYDIIKKKMRKIKKIRSIIVLECSHCKNNPKIHGIYRYTTIKNTKNTSTRLKLKKFCIFSKTHEIFNELK